MFPSLNRDDELNLAFAVIHSPSCQVGKHDEAWMILKQIHDTNMRARGQPEKVFTVSVCVFLFRNSGCLRQQRDLNVVTTEIGWNTLTTQDHKRILNIPTAFVSFRLICYVSPKASNSALFLVPDSEFVLYFIIDRSI